MSAKHIDVCMNSHVIYCIYAYTGERSLTFLCVSNFQNDNKLNYGSFNKIKNSDAFKFPIILQR